MNTTYIPPTVNLHSLTPCNFKCGFCHSGFATSKRISIPQTELHEIIRQISFASNTPGAPPRKVTFAGGEPLLSPMIAEAIHFAKQSGLVTSLITNGSLLSMPKIREFAPILDWLTISIDSLNASTNRFIGRAMGQMLLSETDYRDKIHYAQALGIRVKINTVINRANVNENFVNFICAVRPRRWKLLQAIRISVVTILRVTNKQKICGLEQTLSHGRVEILRELAEPKPGRRAAIDMNKVRIWVQTPLYYAVQLCVYFRMNSSEAVDATSQQARAALGDKFNPEIFKAVYEHIAREANSSGILECIQYLVNDLQVDLDTPNTNDNSALTLAAAAKLNDVAAILLAGGANVNHRFLGGGTALVRAVINDDFQMAKLLMEYKADPLLFVEHLGRPIFAMPMSEKLRTIIPWRY